MLKKLKERLKGRKAIVYTHNLSYEFQFIRKHLTWERIFATDVRKPIECCSDTGIIFRCSYMLSGESLDAVGKKIGVEKKSGQLDYSLIRHSQTPLTAAEMEYCEFDILVVLAYIASQIKQNGGKITKIPLTKTGYVRNYCRRECLPSNSGAWYRYRRIMNQLTLEPEEYKMLHSAFQGGFTHEGGLSCPGGFSQTGGKGRFSCCCGFPQTCKGFFGNS